MERAGEELAATVPVGLTRADAVPAVLLASLVVVAMLRLHNLAFFFLPALISIGHGLYKERLAPLARVAPPLLLFAVFGLYAGASLLWADFPRYARREWVEDFIAPGIGLLAAVLVGARIRPGLPRRFFAAALWALFLLASLVAFLVAPRLGSLGWMERFFDTPGYYSTYCFLLAGATVPFLGRWSRPVFYLALGFCLHLAHQRIAWMVFPLIAVADCLCHARRLDRRLMAAFLLVVTVFSYFMLTARLEDKPVNIFDHSREASGLVSRFLANERVVRWAEWVDLGLRRPLTGTGYGRENSLRTLTGGEYVPIDYLFHAHNVLINVFVQLGVVGLGLFVLAYGRLLWSMKSRLARPSAQAAMLLAVLFLVRNQVDDFSFGRILVVFGLLLGGALAMTFRPAAEEGA